MHGLASPDDGPGSDGSGSDGSGSGDAGMPCLGGGLASICARDPVPATWMVASAMTFDTGNDCDFTVMSASGMLCVKQATDVMISDVLGVVGPLPLVIVAQHDIDVATTGVIDASSISGGVGPGANAMECVAGTPCRN